MAKFVMANNHDITRNDFENICRTCLSRERLKLLYENYLAEMLMACTVVVFAENDGLPAKICTNCINEINKAFSFAKLCETTDKILRKCVIKLETEETNNSSHSQIVEPTIKTEEEIKPAISYRTLKDVLGDYKCKEEVEQEEDVKMKFEENRIEVEGDTKIEIEYDETYAESYKKEVDGEVQDEPYFDNSGFRNKHRCTNSQNEEKNFKDYDCESYDDSVNESYEQEDDDQDETYSGKPDNTPSRLKRKTINPQIQEGSTKNKLGQRKHDTHSKSSNRINQCQKGILTGKKPHICEVCSKGFSLKQTLKTHMRIHTGEKPYTCEICSKGFARKSTLIRHMRQHTGERPYVCRVCSKDFTRSAHLKYHIRSHTGEMPYSCKVCSKGFIQKAQLKLHMRTHTGEKPYACEICSKGFIQKAQLKLHMRIHTGEKPYACEICSKCFARNAELKLHMRTHTGEKPYACQVCSKKFSDPSTRRKHMRIHTGEKPYACQVCSKGFIQNVQLKLHMRVHTDL